MKKAIVIKITGQVQGVGFRWSAKNKADDLKIFGYAKNEPGGRVLIEVEGETTAVDKFVDWCKNGPDSAQVEQLDIENTEPKGHRSFEIVLN
ncbi:MAG: acylphosphatase [Candidatus Berkelbacteria bacterium]|nr:acylphosphatase [Candidatus Berkelbacteria bacterium]